MKKKCGCNKPCQCGDNVISQGSACSGYPSCSEVEQCFETQDGKCLIYTGDEIVNIAVPQGARFNEIIQKLVGMITNPGCNSPNSPCSAVIFNSDYITPTTIRVKWGIPSGFSGNFQIYYRKTGTVNFSLNTAVSSTVNTDTAAGLEPDTYYEIKIASICPDLDPCFSVTLKIKTKIQ